MASWFEHGRPAIFEALANVCEKIDRDLRDELQQRKPVLKDAATFTAPDDVLEKKLAVIDNLETENMILRAQLAVMTQRHDEEASRRAPASSVSMPAPRPTPSAAESIHSSSDGAKVEKSDFIKLQMRFNALSDNFKKAKEALQKRKDERDKWVERARMLEKKLRTAEDEHGIRILDRSNRVGRDGKYTTSFTSDDGISGCETTLPPLIEATTTDNNRGANMEDPQLQSTQGEPEEETEDLPSLPANNGNHDSPAIKQEPSSDAPVVVSERVLKRRRVEDSGCAATGARRVKVESTSSSPLPSLERYGLNIQESIDLDDIAQKIQTPRKRKELEESLEQDESCEQAVPSSLTPTPLFVRPDPPQQSARVVRKAPVLTPVSGNKRIVKPTSDKPNATALKNGLGYGISVLAEDGGIYEKDASDRKHKSSNTPNSVVKGRLDVLLNSSAPENRSTISRSGQALQSSFDSPQDRLLIPERRELPFENAARQINKRQSVDTNLTSRLKMPDQRTPVRDRSPQRKKGSGSGLRHRPLSELRLDDFKINPLANEGHDFAFSDVVRDRDDRACLPGCTDMHCCGKSFRALALSQRPNPPLTAAQRQEEQKLLESYLGDYSYRLATLSKEERAELWLEAKTEELANKYGKHRHRYSRMRSPPGFWNADFPDTQELEADREEASKREKQAIGDRYREATRPGGRWLFRDE